MPTPVVALSSRALTRALKDSALRWKWLAWQAKLEACKTVVAMMSCAWTRNGQDAWPRPAAEANGQEWTSGNCPARVYADSNVGRRGAHRYAGVPLPRNHLLLTLLALAVRVVVPHPAVVEWFFASAAIGVVKG